MKREIESSSLKWILPTRAVRISTTISGGATAILKCVTGHRLCPSWMSFDCEPVTTGKGCRRRAPAFPILCNVVLDDAIGDTAPGWSKTGYGVAQPILAICRRNRYPRSEAHASQRFTTWCSQATTSWWGRRTRKSQACSATYLRPSSLGSSISQPPWIDSGSPPLMV